MNRQPFARWMVAISLAAWISLGWTISIASQDKSSAEGSIRIKMQGSDNDHATVTVFREGKALATKDLLINAGEAEFKNLQLGAYEVRLECPGWKTLVRRAILTEMDKTAELMPKMTKGGGTLVVGPGPSLQELEARIQKLESSVPPRKRLDLKIEAGAQGVKVQTVGFQGSAHLLSYDVEKGILTLEGTADAPATLVRNRQNEEVHATKIIYSLKEDTWQAQGNGGVRPLKP